MGAEYRIGAPPAVVGDTDATLRDVEYVLPLRWHDDEAREELTAYLSALTRAVDVTVVDGSPPALFAAHHDAWPWVRHIPPAWPGLNGKARGAMTGLARARHELVIIADDDVRYDPASLAAVRARLESADFVRPQNYFASLPWHARWDTGRTVLNRASGGDFSGTIAVRRSILTSEGYDTDVLFENLQLERTVRALGGRVDVAHDVFVERLPPRVDRFWEQRVRQAYDEFARPWRLILQLLVLPALAAAAATRNWRAVAIAAAAVVAVAEAGRRRACGAGVFDRAAALWALPWLAERSVTSWLALVHRLCGGIPYRGARLERACSPLGPRRRRRPRTSEPIR
jgi:hypothetical protein